MQKHLFLYPFICAAAIIGILLLAVLLFRIPADSPEAISVPDGAYFVREAMHFANI